MVMDIQLTSCHIYAVASRLAVVEIPLFLLCLQYHLRILFVGGKWHAAIDMVNLL